MKYELPHVVQELGPPARTSAPGFRKLKCVESVQVLIVNVPFIAGWSAPEIITVPPAMEALAAPSVTVHVFVEQLMDVLEIGDCGPSVACPLVIVVAVEQAVTDPPGLVAVSVPGFHAAIQ